MARVTFSIAIPGEVTLDATPLRFGAVAEPSDLVTTCGWHYALATEGDGSVVATYAFLDHVGVVRARGPRELVLAVLAAARPDWRGDEVVALAQLWGPEP